jgi:AcrR family transcriptional regulator
MVNKEMYQQRIMEASRRLFLDKGYKNASLVEVADDTKIGRRTIYRYFENKELLLLKVLTQTFDEFNRYMDNIEYKDVASGYNKLEVLFDGYAAYFLGNAEMLRLLAMVDVNVSDVYKETGIYNEFITSSGYIDKILMEILLEGKNDGSIHFDIDVEVLTVTVNNSLLSLASRVINHKTELDSEQGVESTKMLIALKNLILKSVS